MAKKPSKGGFPKGPGAPAPGGMPKGVMLAPGGKMSKPTTPKR